MPDARPVSTSVVRRRWGSSVFGIVAEGHARRRPSDIVRVVIVGVLVAVAAVGASETTRLEAAVFDLFVSLPDGLEPVWRALYLLAPIVAGALLVAALVARRMRLLLTQALAMGVTWLVGVAISAAVDLPDDLPVGSDALNGHTPDFPVILLATGAAGLWASRPYLTRPAGRTLEGVFWLSAIGAAALTEGLPGAVIASLLLAWGAAALAHLCVGSPAATPSLEQVAASLRDLGVDPDGLRLAPEQTWGDVSYTAGSDGELSIDVVGRDATDARLFAKLWRFVWYKDSGPTLSLTREHQVEHEAYVLFLAGRTGARRVRRGRRRAGRLARRRHRRRAEPGGDEPPRAGGGAGHRRRPRRRVGEPGAAARRPHRPRQPLGGQRRGRRRRHDRARRPRRRRPVGHRRPAPARPGAAPRHLGRARGRGPGAGGRPSGAQHGRSRRAARLPRAHRADRSPPSATSPTRRSA